jgi:hypothetical protein
MAQVVECFQGPELKSQYWPPKMLNMQKNGKMILFCVVLEIELPNLWWASTLGKQKVW